MEPDGWIPDDARTLLDVGCNVGDLLVRLGEKRPDLRLAGTDINRGALEKARSRLPAADIVQMAGGTLPFAAKSFDCITCIEVIEHVPPEHRAELGQEFHRVLRDRGILIVRCPHAGLFDWLDAQNFRFRAPKVYRALVRSGGRDASYEDAKEEIVWHHHFTESELLTVLGPGWQLEGRAFGGLLLFPITDILSWPFYRLGLSDHRVRRFLEAVASADYSVDFGKLSFGILLALRKA